MSYLNSGRDERGSYSEYITDHGVVIKVYW